MSKFPLITIAITCFNAFETIERAIISSLAQDWGNFEVLVVDDCSNDSSLSILNLYAEKDHRVRVIRHTINSGCSKARNTLISEAKGDFLVFFDDDDFSNPNRLRLQYERIFEYELKTGALLVACYASGERVYPNGYIIPIKAVGTEGFSPVGIQMVDFLLFNKKDNGFFYGAGTPTCSLMARTSVFRALDGFDENISRQEDIDFAIRLGLQGGHFIGVSEPVLTQYVTTGNEKSARVEFESTIYIINKNSKYLQINNSYIYMKLWTEMRFRHFSGQDFSAFIFLCYLILHNPVRTIRHFCISASRRFIHERRMRRDSLE